MLIANILSIVLTIFAFLCVLGYFYVVIWVMPHKKEKLQELSWLCWLCIFLAIILFALAGAINSAEVRGVFQIFILVAFMIGLLFRQSAISPYELSEYWLRRAKNKLRNYEK
jgi:uncharacterized membrane protein YoaK (UPF0700 family)